MCMVMTPRLLQQRKVRSKMSAWYDVSVRVFLCSEKKNDACEASHEHRHALLERLRLSEESKTVNRVAVGPGGMKGVGARAVSELHREAKGNGG